MSFNEMIMMVEGGRLFLVIVLLYLSFLSQVISWLF